MSLPTPTGNPLPFGRDHPCFDVPENRAWIAREAKADETIEQTLDRMAAELSKFYPGFEPFDWRTFSSPSNGPTLVQRHDLWLCISLWVTGVGDSPEEARADWTRKHTAHLGEVESARRLTGLNSL
jgi:hypothetical protein